MNELVDRFGLASNLIDNIFIDIINGTNQDAVDEAFKGLGLSRVSVENKLMQVNEKVNPFHPEQIGHNASKKIIYKAILTMMWEEKMTDEIGKLN